MNVSTRTRSYVRWLIVALIAVATVINYIDRNALAVMWPQISKDVGATKEDYALLVTVFMLFYAAGQFVFGRLFDIIGTRMGFALSIAVWSISIALHSVTHSILSFSIVRAMLGISEAGAWPGAVKANAEWFPARERALAQGVFNAGASIGAIISAPLIAVLFLWLGWRGTFILIGAIGFVWLLPWLIIYRAGPDKHPWVSAAERALILDAPAEQPAVPKVEYVPNVRQLLGHRQTWGILTTRFFIDPIWWLFVSWLPIYLADTFGFDIKQIGIFAWVPYVGAMIGSLGGGWLSGRLIGAGWSVDRARKWVITLGGAIMAPALLGAVLATDPVWAVVTIAFVLFGFQIAIGNIQTLPGDIFNGRSVGSLAGLGGMAAVAGTLITTWLVPVMTRDSYAPIFILVAALVPASLLALWLVTGRVEKLDAPPSR
ncbi:ACS family hexuronate transporter-like MFS transporter [Stenotrophomonas rhizophila]|uniref:ACS family hexuronate transporter-like MFS transporter n=1 Tax=Stenotrophomonas rhizophila TaxID=216778 RepID=A0AAP5AL92_9GAMM|nr:MFS transporter [Stenotrophomonas rhizophila]AOA70909.1 MFS transporter [Stenotrophomonas rhizophila]MDQ1110151.1 ACS family hexuronate transporter-like MFS transporter [Stenotrophomonas rhizophila]UQY88039.1 MFS transporter [Stenotrophomonas rhizophila]